MSALADGELETGLEMAGAFRRGEVTPIELVERALARLEAWQPFTNAFSQVWADEAVDAARNAGRVRREEYHPLTGIPVAVKDLFDVAGHETTGCCAAYRGRGAAPADAPVVAAWRAAGAIFVGKTNQHELAAGGTNLVSACGRTGNPWDPARMTGGSSGGSGAAVASGVVPLALGSDTGGSIRIPAAMCGCFGLKPTQGRFPLKGIMPLAPSMDCPGPMASTARDLHELAYRAIGDMGVRVRHGPSSSEDERVHRIGLPDGGFFDRFVHDETRATVARAAETLRAAGHHVETVDGAGLDGVRALWMQVTTPEFWQAHPSLRGQRLDLVAPQPRAWLEQGSRVTQEERERASRDREAVRTWFVERLERIDALLVPTTPYPAPGADQRTVDLGSAGEVEVEQVGPGFMTCSVNLSGLPAVNVPAGRSSAGLPIGVTLIGQASEEWTLLGLAESWERAAGYRPERPPPPSKPA